MELDARAKFFSITELLSLVFEFCLPDEDAPTADPRAAPVLLTRICRMWRDVALATPRLWARLCLVCLPSVPCRVLTDRHVHVLSDWLLRSGSCPTSLVLRYLGSSACDVRNISRILDVTAPHSHRWHEMSITAPMPCLQSIIHLLGHATPRLEICRISITSSNAPSEREDLIVDLDNSITFRLNAITLDLAVAQKLRHLNLTTDALTDLIIVTLPPALEALTLNNFDLLLGPAGLTPNFRCHNLRKLVLRSHIHLTLLHQLAQAFPFLEEGFFNIKYGMESVSVFESNHASVSFPNLKSLTLRAVSTNGDADLHALGLCLQVLHLPMLERLSLTISFAILQVPWTSLSEHIKRIRPPLKELNFVGACFAEDDFLDILRQAPQLESLKMCVRLSDIALDGLTLREDTAPYDDVSSFTGGLCPRLKHLDIPLASPCSAGSVIAMILSRCAPPPSADVDQRTPALLDDRCPQTSLEACRLVLSEAGIIEQIEQHLEIIRSVERGLRLDLRAF